MNIIFNRLFIIFFSTIILSNQVIAEYNHEQRDSTKTNHVAYIIKEGRKQYVLLNGVRGKFYNKIYDLIISSDKKHIAYCGVNTGFWKGKIWIVIDRAEKQYDAYILNTLKFSPDSKHTSFVTKKGRKYSVVLDEKLGDLYDGIAEGGAIFSPDGSRIANIAKESNEWFVVVDGKEQNRFDDIGKSTLIFSPDGKRIAYSARESNKWFVVVDGKKQNRFDGIGKGTPIFSQNSNLLAYAALEDQEWFLIIEGEEKLLYQGEKTENSYRAAIEKHFYGEPLSDSQQIIITDSYIQQTELSNQGSKKSEKIKSYGYWGFGYGVPYSIGLGGLMIEMNPSYHIVEHLGVTIGLGFIFTSGVTSYGIDHNNEITACIGIRTYLNKKRNIIRPYFTFCFGDLTKVEVEHYYSWNTCAKFGSAIGIGVRAKHYDIGYLFHRYFSLSEDEKELKGPRGFYIGLSHYF